MDNQQTQKAQMKYKRFETLKNGTETSIKQPHNDAR